MVRGILLLPVLKLMQRLTCGVAAVVVLVSSYYAAGLLGLFVTLNACIRPAASGPLHGLPFAGLSVIRVRVLLSWESG